MSHQLQDMSDWVGAQDWVGRAEGQPPARQSHATRAAIWPAAPERAPALPQTRGFGVDFRGRSGRSLQKGPIPGKPTLGVSFFDGTIFGVVLKGPLKKTPNSSFGGRFLKRLSPRS